MELTQSKQTMMNFIDKLCDHLSNEKIKVLIDNGFDQWQTLTYLKGEQLVQLNYTPQQCIVIMVAINATCRQSGIEEQFSQDTMTKIISLAKQREIQTLHEINDQQQQAQTEQKVQKVYKKYQPKQYPKKQITQVLLSKGTSMKNQPLQSITMISIQQKGITHITLLQKLSQLQILHLSHNHIYKIENLSSNKKLKTLKLDYNEICQMQGFEELQLLQKLHLNDNHINFVKGLGNNRNLHILDISNQQIYQPLAFQQISMYAMSYCLEKLDCNNSHVENIQSFKHLLVVKQISMKGNNLKQVGEISEALGSMQMLKKLDFRNNPITKTQKYRDYMVILSKNLQQLDAKKILVTQRQYLVKLYSLKHANQFKDKKGYKSSTKTKCDVEVQGTKMEQTYGGNKFYQGADLRGNIPYQNTKNMPKK